MPMLNQAMDPPFRWEVLQRALAGKPIWDLNHQWILDWMDRHLPAPAAPVDVKSAAAGEKDNEQ